MNTMTVTATAEIIPYTLRVASSLVLAQKTLREIVDTFEGASDPLSLKLRTWSAKVFDEDPNVDNSGSLSGSVKAHIHELVTKILINPIEPISLKEPVIDRNLWIWEASLLEDYQKLSTLSPFDGKQIQAQPHLFAKMILVWAKFKSPAEFDELEKLEKEQHASCSISKLNLSDAEKLNLYLERAEGVISIQEERDRTKLLKDMRVLIAEEGRTLEQDCKAMEAQSTRMAEERNEALEHVVSETECIFNSTVSELESRIKEQSQKLQTANDQVASANTRISAAENTILSLSARLNQQEIQLQHQNTQLSHMNQQVSQLSQQAQEDGCILS